MRFEEEDIRIDDARGVSLQVLITAAEFLLGPTPAALKADWSKNGGKMPQKAAKWRLLREKATLLAMAQLLYCQAVALIFVK